MLDMIVSVPIGPPATPVRIVIRPDSSRARKASRTVCRLTPNWFPSSVSEGSLSPGFQYPLRIESLIVAATSSNALFDFLIGLKDLPLTIIGYLFAVVIGASGDCVMAVLLFFFMLTVILISVWEVFGHFS